MPKLKTNRATAKRFKKTATGKIKRSHAFLRHINGYMTRKRKRALGRPALVSKADEYNINRLLPYA
jgi:large subunit ribosomal protein L35